MESVLDNTAATASLEVAHDSSIAIDLSSSGNFSFTTWFKADTIPPPTNVWLAQKTSASTSTGEGEFALAYTPTGSISWGLQSIGSGWDWCRTLDEGFYITDKYWHHVALVKDGTSMKMYVDGVMIEECTYTKTPSITNNEPLFIGGKHNDTEFFPGYMDEVSVWTKALTSSEVLDMQTTAINSSATGLGALYNFTSGSIAQDSTANGNTATRNANHTRVNALRE